MSKRIGAGTHVAPVACWREQLHLLEERGQLVRIKKRVSPKFEIAAIAKRMDPGPALLFENVEGYDIPIALGTDGDRDGISASFGLTALELVDHYVNAITSPLPPKTVSEGPVKEVVQVGEIDIMADLPVMTHYERDGGPYISNGLVISENLEQRIHNMSWSRLQVTGPDELRAYLGPFHLRQMFEEAEEHDKPLPIAVILGADSAERLAAATRGSAIPIHLSDSGISGALKGQPEELIKCETSDVRVPANAEIVIEGEILPHVRMDEGPFAEFTGNYAPVAKSPVIKVKAITRRRDAIYQGLLAFSSEHLNLLALPYEPVLLKTLRGVIPETQGVHVTPGSCGKFHAVVRIKKHHEGDGKDAILAGLHAIRDIKLITVVDDDVDPFNMRDVEWAVATRFQADKDLVVISGARGTLLDPSTFRTGMTAKMGIDATKSLTEPESFEKVVVPGTEDLDLAAYLGGS